MIEAALILWDIALPKLDGLTGQGGLLARVKAKMGSLILCVISLTYIEPINLCVLCVFVVRSSRSLAGIYLIKYILPTKPKRADRRQKRVIGQKEAMGCYYLKPIPRKQPN